jgi:inosose dehydratase
MASAPLAGAKHTGPRLACQCYVFEQEYGQKQQRALDHADEIFVTLHEAGYRAVELTSSFFPVGQTDGTLALLDKHALALPIAYIGGPMHDESASRTVETALAYADRLKAHKGLEAISFNCDPKPGHAAKTDAELQIEAQALEQLGSALAQKQLRLLVHQHAPEMANHAREWRYFVKHTTAKNVGICMDTHWSLRGGEDALEILREAGKRVGDVHLRNSKDGVWLEELADGDLDYRAIAAELKQTGYGGWLTVELAWDPKTQFTRPLGENLRRSREYAERVFGVK